MPTAIRPNRLAALLLAALCSSATALAADQPDAKATAPATHEDFLSADMDPSVDPRKDFFAYANGHWLATHPIPASESSWGIGDLVEEQIYASLRKINENANIGSKPAGTYKQKVGDFWMTAMDTAKAEELGVHPLDKELGRIDAVETPKDVFIEAFELLPLSVDVFFVGDVSQDEKNSDAMAVHFSQGGLGLPERDFYFNPEAGVARIREEYVAHIARTLELLGRKPEHAADDAKKVMEFETGLAKASRKLEDLRDPDKNYHPMTPDDFTAKYSPDIPWTDRMFSWNVHPDMVVVGQPEFFQQMDKLVQTTPMPVLRDYMRVHLVDTYAFSLSKAFDDEYFHFYGQVLHGQKEPRERWKRVLDTEGRSMGMVLGQVFVTNYFSPKAKQRYVALVEAIRTAYHDRIEKLDWMSPETKAKAEAKLAAVMPKVGYPDKWRDMSTLNIGSDSYCQNLLNAALWNFNYRMDKFGQPVDRSEWDMTPQTYNAYYNPSNNEIVLPAAIFTVPGVADADVDDAVAYGYVAAGTIGHEITHGFDDEGRKFDAHGNLADWWTADDAKKFEQHAQVMIDEFNAFEPIPSLHINGKASLGENIADYGGLLLGLDAFKKTEQYRKGEKIGGLTPIQRYFLGYAMGWMSQERQEVLREHLLSDVHAPAKWRVIGPLTNIPEFDEAFGIKPGDPMWRPEEQRVHIW
ncbi:MAG TPA: M13 family metallopeptidase [Xanthomonadaceae bacterium]